MSESFKTIDEGVHRFYKDGACTILHNLQGPAVWSIKITKSGLSKYYAEFWLDGVKMTQAKWRRDPKRWCQIGN